MYLYNPVVTKGVFGGRRWNENESFSWRKHRMRTIDARMRSVSGRIVDVNVVEDVGE